jgi:hypothetical protein
MAMNDNDLITAMRDRFDPIRMDTPADVIMTRGRAVRRRGHHGRLAAAALAVGLGAGLGIPGVTAHDAAKAPNVTNATLAAWTVQKHSDGSVAVTIREPKNLTALQARLARLGVPVVIRVGSASCLPMHLVPVPKRIIGYKTNGEAITFEIHPVTIPARKGLLIILPAPGKPLVPLHALPAAKFPRPPTMVFVPRGPLKALPVVAIPVLKCPS